MLSFPMVMIQDNKNKKDHDAYSHFILASIIFIGSEIDNNISLS